MVSFSTLGRARPTLSPWLTAVAIMLTCGVARAQAERPSSITGHTIVKTNRTSYLPGEVVAVAFAKGPGNATDWIGIYRLSEHPGGPQASSAWQYVGGSDVPSTATERGVVTFASGLPRPGGYVAYLLIDGGYVPAGRCSFEVVGSVAGSESERDKGARARDDASDTNLRDLERLRQVREDFQRFILAQAPELVEALAATDDAIAEREMSIDEVVRTLTAMSRNPKKDKDVIRWRKKLADMRKLREKLTRRTEDLYVDYQKAVHAPEERVRQRVASQAAAANTFAAKAQSTLRKLIDTAERS